VENSRTRTDKASRIMLDGLTLSTTTGRARKTAGSAVHRRKCCGDWTTRNTPMRCGGPGADPCEFERGQELRVSALGTCGVQLYDGCDGATIQGNYFFDSTAAGVIVGRSAHLVTSDPSSETQRNTNTLVSDNVVRNTGSDFTQATGIDCIHAEMRRSIITIFPTSPSRVP